MRPILEQAAAAAAVVSDTEGIAKAQAAAKKAKKLTPEEMKKMRQQADPNYQNKQAAAAATAGDGIATGSKKGKRPAARAETAAQAESASLPAAAAAAEPTVKVASADAMPSDAGARKHSTAQAATQALHDQASAAGSKRHHGLGFSEDQPGPKRSKQADGADKPAGSPQQAQQAQQPPSSFTAGPPSRHPLVAKPQSLQSKPASVVAAEGAQSSAGAAQGPPVIFTDECTAFVRGLDNKVTEEELRNLLAVCGEIKGVRLVMDKVTSMFKVVILLSLQHAYIACIFLRHLMFWSCTSVANLLAGMERLHTVAQLALDGTFSMVPGHDCLLNACRQCMDAACNRFEDNAYCTIQGFGYVEFANNSALQKAVDLKEPELHSRKMSIMVSKPPSGGPGRGGGRGRGVPGRGFGAGRGDRGRSIHQHERLAVAAAPAFVPRAIAKAEVSGKAPATTNADFRKLLNKK